MLTIYIPYTELTLKYHTLCLRNANAGDVYVNRRGSEYRRIVCKLEGLREFYVNSRVSGYQRIVCKLEGLRVSKNCM